MVPSFPYGPGGVETVFEAHSVKEETGVCTH